MEHIIFIIVTTSFVWLSVWILFYLKKKRDQNIHINEIIKFTEHIENSHNSKVEILLKEKATEYLTVYKMGFQDGVNSKKLEIVVFPWSEEIDHSTFWKTKKSLKAGYQHQLYIDGVPSFQPHIIVVDEIVHEKLNEQNIREVFSKIGLLINALPNSEKLALSVLSDSKDLVAALISQIKSKK